MKAHRLTEIISVDWRATGMAAGVWHLSGLAFGWQFANTVTVLAIAFGLALWHNGVGALVKRLHAERGGSWAPWCGWREYWRQVSPVVLAALVFFLAWAYGALVLGW